MAVYTPRDWTVGQLVTQAQLDAEFNGIYDALGDWTLAPSGAWTPAITATSINVTYSVQEGRYLIFKKTVFAVVNLKLNVVTNAGTGDYSINLPVDSRDPGSSFLNRVGTADIYDNSATTLYQAVAVRSAASTCKLRRDGTSGNVQATAPFTFATNDEICIRFLYATA